jgi:hypothetical protein
MTSNPPQRNRWTIAAIVVVVLVVSYPLSEGPAQWLYDHHYLSGRTFFTVYKPLRMLRGQMPEPALAFWRWYFLLFSDIFYIR